MVDFRAVIENLIDIGFYDVFLPFILVYAVVFAILEKSGILAKEGDEKSSRSINAVISFVFGLFVIASLQTVKYIQNLIINIVLVIIFILVTLILLGFIFGKDYFDHLFKDADGKVKKSIVWSVAGIVILTTLTILLQILGFWEWLSNSSNVGITSSDITTYVIFAAIIGVLVWITKGSSSSEGGKSE